MSEVLKRDVVTGPLGRFKISTIRTIAGGAAATRPPWAPWDDATYVDETPWPFETMVFRDGSSTGLYHAPYATKEEALAGHQLMAETIKSGAEFGGGVTGPCGVPSMTPEEWKSKAGAT